MTAPIDAGKSKTYLTIMNARAKFSAKGQIVIPKDVRERYHFDNGQIVEVVERPDGVLLRTPTGHGAASFDAALAAIRSAVHYDGPPIPIEELSWHIRDPRKRR